jgi:hypothetical protein
MSSMSSKMLITLLAGESTRSGAKRGRATIFIAIFFLYPRHTQHSGYFSFVPKFCPCRGRLWSRCSSNDPLSCKLRPRTGLDLAADSEYLTGDSIMVAFTFTICDIDVSLTRPSCCVCMLLPALTTTKKKIICSRQAT